MQQHHLSVINTTWKTCTRQTGKDWPIYRMPITQLM